MGRKMRLPGATSRMSRLPPQSPWPSMLVVTSRSGATPRVPMNGVIGQLRRSLKWRVPSRVVPLGVGVWRVAVEAGAAAGDGQVLRRLEVAAAGVPGLDLERLAGPHAQQRLVPP